MELQEGYGIAKVKTSVQQTEIRTKELTRFIVYDKKYTQLYRTARQQIKGIHAMLSIHLFFWCLECMDNKNIIYLFNINKKLFCEEYKCNLRSLSRNIRELRENNILIYLDRGIYRVNILHSWKGDREVRLKQIKSGIGKLSEKETEPRFLGEKVYERMINEQQF